MDFAFRVAAAVVLVALSLALQCAGMALVIDWGLTHMARDKHRLGPARASALIVRYATVMVSLHLCQILLWAGFYRWNCFPSWESAFYFSSVSYSTVGYGDLILPRMWRVLGPLEAMTGVLMCGMSVSLLFAVVTRLVDREVRLAPELLAAVLSNKEAPQWLSTSDSVSSRQ
jgi:voltage-gated potassium channel